MNLKTKSRKNLRLKNFDYRQPGFYFVTLCVKDRKNHFGEIIEEQMNLSNLGNVVEECWKEISIHFPHMRLDEFSIMPNHIHGIIEILRDQTSVGAENFRPLRTRDNDGNVWHGAQSRSLSSAIRGFKIGVTKWCRENDYSGSIWQRYFYDKIIRDEIGLNNVREYIRRNPRNWEKDLENEKIYDQMKPEVRRIKLKMHYDGIVEDSL